MKNYVVESSRMKGIYNSWSTKLLKGHTSSFNRMYRMKEVYRCYITVATRRAGSYASEAISNMPKSHKSKLSHNQLNKKIKTFEKFGISVPKSIR